MIIVYAFTFFSRFQFCSFTIILKQSFLNYMYLFLLTKVQEILYNLK